MADVRTAMENAAVVEFMQGKKCVRIFFSPSVKVMNLGQNMNLVKAIQYDGTVVAKSFQMPRVFSLNPIVVFQVSILCLRDGSKK